MSQMVAPPGVRLARVMSAKVVNAKFSQARAAVKVAVKLAARWRAGGAGMVQV